VPPAIEITAAAAMVKEVFFTIILLVGFQTGAYTSLLHCDMLLLHCNNAVPRIINT
jgi:hypothetical protein